jgi:hypothetical protein
MVRKRNEQSKEKLFTATSEATLLQAGAEKISQSRGTQIARRTTYRQKRSTLTIRLPAEKKAGVDLRDRHLHQHVRDSVPGSVVCRHRRDVNREGPQDHRLRADIRGSVQDHHLHLDVREGVRNFPRRLRADAQESVQDRRLQVEAQSTQDRPLRTNGSGIRRGHHRYDSAQEEAGELPCRRVHLLKEESVEIAPLPLGPKS